MSETRMYGRYEAREIIGHGGMATVVLAYDPSLDREVALKVLSPQYQTDSAFLKRFIREARTVANLDHPAIVPIHDVNERHSPPFLVMKLMTGGTLRDRLDEAKGEPLPLDETLEIMRRVCAALDAAHAKEIIHRDIKPENIIYDEKGQAYLADFGIARPVEGGTMTTTGVLGTPDYLSPEQANQEEIDTRSDIYQLGCVLFHLLTGRVPFPEEKPLAKLLAHMQTMPPSASELNPRLPPAVDEVISQAMAKSKEARFRSAGEMLQALETTINTPIRPEKEAAAEENKKRTLPVRGSIAILGVVSLGLLVWAGFNFMVGNGAGRETELPAANVPEDMILIPADSFLMGCGQGEPSCNENERPLHGVILDEYLIDKYEVTNAAYAACVAAGSCNAPSSTESWTRNSYYNIEEYGNFPVIWVSWNDATDYCRWAGKRLPTEAEWEKAARGSSDTRPFPWGNDPPTCELSNFKRDGSDCFGDTSEVGSYPDGASPYGVMDMSGNVWEWVADLYDGEYYQNSPERNPGGPSTGEFRTTRGGGWDSTPLDIRVSNRNNVDPTATGDAIGFRCAAEPGG